MHPLKVRKEVEAFLADRMMEALWREALHLLNEGFAFVKYISAASAQKALEWHGHQYRSLRHKGLGTYFFIMRISTAIFCVTQWRAFKTNAFVFCFVMLHLKHHS